MLGSAFEAAVFPILPHIRGPGPLLLLYIALAAVGSVLYWTAYHAYFASLGDAELRGHQISVREAASALVGWAGRDGFTVRVPRVFPG